jgi:heptosyltransferase III
VLENRHIIVFRGGALGDFIVTLPVLAALKTGRPAAQLSLVASPAHGVLALAGRCVDEAWSLDDRGLASFFHPTAPLDADWARRLAGADLIVSFLHDADGVFHSRIAECTRATVLRGPHRPNEHRPMHVTDQLLAPLLDAGFAVDPIPEWRPAVPPLPEARLAIHPGSGSGLKNWPEHRWAEWLKDRVSPAGWPVLILGGEAEPGRAARLASFLPPGRARIMENPPLALLAAELSRVAGLIGHDSGVSHLAAAVGIPGLALWGPGNPDVWMPRSPHWRRLQAPGALDILTVGMVDALMSGLVPEWFQAVRACPES